MKLNLAFALLTAFIVGAHPLLASDGEEINRDTILKLTPNGEEIAVEPLIVGEVSLYRQPYEESQVRLEVIGPELHVIKHRYFIGGEIVEEINLDNYRPLIKKYLVNAPELHQKLGRSGFRHENIPSMIVYYNRFKSEEPLAMKYDLRTISTLLMEK